MVERTLVLMNDVALQMRPDALNPGDCERIVVAGCNLVRMTLAELALPGARMIWTDFRHSASLGTLNQAVQAAGGVDRLILATDGEQGEAAFPVMCAVLTLLPSLRRRGGGRVELICASDAAARSLQTFVERMQPKLRSDGVDILIERAARQPDRTIA